MKASYLVYGAGAVGGVIGGRLHLAGLPVTLIARGDHLTAIRGSGLVLDAPDGRHRVDVPATDSAAGVPWTDATVVLLTVKSQDTAAALDDLVAHAPPDVMVVCAQNGVANEREALRRLSRTYGITVMLPAGHLEPGVVVQGSAGAPGILDIGRVPDGVDAVCETVAADLRAAGFESVACPDVLAWKHRKLLLNLGNGVDAAFAPGPDADEITRLARLQGERVLAAAGVPLVTAETDRRRRADHLRPRSDADRSGSSTWQSLQRGGSTEIDHLSGEIVLQARLHGLAAPINAAVQRAVHDLTRTGGAPRTLDAAAVLARLPPAGGG